LADEADGVASVCCGLAVHFLSMMKAYLIAICGRICSAGTVQRNGGGLKLEIADFNKKSERKYPLHFIILVLH
jgi:hypothetical protein